MSDSRPLPDPTSIEESSSTADPVAVSSPAVPARHRKVRASAVTFRPLTRAFAGVTAVGVKELRGRMRGRRAFVILTTYLVLLAAFAFMMELILERRHGSAFGGSAAFASAQIGQGIFAALLMLETLLVVALAPAFTASAISLEREKQTLDLLATTPISSLAIVLGKLLSALTYLFILIFASIPLTAIVFVFGGVSPDDVVRGYVILLATALGLGSVGLFFSALVRRTQAATIVTYFGVLAVTLGAFFIFFFWHTMASIGPGSGQGEGPIRQRPPEALLYLNPYFAQTDVLCGVESGFGDWCERMAFITDRPIFGAIDLPVQPMPAGREVFREVANDGQVNGLRDVVIDDHGGERFGVIRDTFWPKSVVAWLVLSAVLILASVQFVTPTRRWRPRLPGITRRLTRRSSP